MTILCPYLGREIAHEPLMIRHFLPDHQLVRYTAVTTQSRVGTEKVSTVSTISTSSMPAHASGQDRERERSQAKGRDDALNHFKIVRLLTGRPELVGTQQRHRVPIFSPESRKAACHIMVSRLPCAQ